MMIRFFLVILLFITCTVHAAQEKFAGFIFGSSYKDVAAEIKKQPSLKFLRKEKDVYWYSGNTVVSDTDSEMSFSFNKDRLYEIEVHLMGKPDEIPRYRKLWLILSEKLRFKHAGVSTIDGVTFVGFRHSVDISIYASSDKLKEEMKKQESDKIKLGLQGD